MKFEILHDVEINDEVEFESTKILKSNQLGECDHCGSLTKWKDVTIKDFVCSEECCTERWQKHYADNPELVRETQFKMYQTEAEKELKIAADFIDSGKSPHKDIIVVVHDQLNYLKECIESIQKHTNNFTLYIWDNASGKETQDYIENLLVSHDNIESMRSEINTGFIKPNNDMAEWGSGDYLICLNSDTKVFEGWDAAMIGFIEKNDVAQVGYLGGWLDETFRGSVAPNPGYNIDYVMGWCFAISRKIYDKFGLFNKQLTFAYCEDSDLSLRLKEAGEKIYSLHAPLVHHYGNKTIEKVSEEKEVDIKSCVDLNYQYVRERWKSYLKNDRACLKKAI